LANEVFVNIDARCNHEKDSSCLFIYFYGLFNVDQINNVEWWNN